MRGSTLTGSLIDLAPLRNPLRPHARLVTLTVSGGSLARQGPTMLTIPGPRSRFGDGMSRRSWLRIGGLALGGLALPDILRAESQSGVRGQAKGIIMVLLPGGPTHLDMYDLK